MSGKNNATKVDDSLGTNHLVVCCDIRQLTFEARFVTSGWNHLEVEHINSINDSRSLSRYPSIFDTSVLQTNSNLFPFSCRVSEIFRSLKISETEIRTTPSTACKFISLRSFVFENMLYRTYYLP